MVARPPPLTSCSTSSARWWVHVLHASPHARLLVTASLHALRVECACSLWLATTNALPGHTDVAQTAWLQHSSIHTACIRIPMQVIERFIERVPPCTLPPPANQVGGRRPTMLGCAALDSQGRPKLPLMMPDQRQLHAPAGPPVAVSHPKTCAEQVHPNARKKVATPKPGSEEEAALHREQGEALLRQAYQEGKPRRILAGFSQV